MSDKQLFLLFPPQFSSRLDDNDIAADAVFLWIHSCCLLCGPPNSLRFVEWLEKHWNSLSSVIEPPAWPIADVRTQKPKTKKKCLRRWRSVAARVPLLLPNLIAIVIEIKWFSLLTWVNVKCKKRKKSIFCFLVCTPRTPRTALVDCVPETYSWPASKKYKFGTGAARAATAQIRDK